MRNFPVPKSKTILGLEWLTDRVGYPDPMIKGDTFPMTWADDGEIYTSAGDPIWGCDEDGLDAEKFTGMAPDYKIWRLNSMKDYVGWGGWGQKPSGMICVDGVLYLAFQNQLGYKPPAHGGQSQHGSDSGIVLSIDHGVSWRPGMKEMRESPTQGVMFPGSKFGGPAFVNFGRNNAGAVDDFVYAVSTDQWDNGSELRLGRVRNDRIMHPASWQWVSELGKTGAPKWTSDLEASVPVLVDDRYISLPEMVYLAGIKRYLLLTWRLKLDFATSGSDLIIYESPNPWGPFALVHYEELYGGKECTMYCPRVPLKWMEPDGITGWMQHSGSWAKGSPYYRSNVRKFRLKMR